MSKTWPRTALALPAALLSTLVTACGAPAPGPGRSPAPVSPAATTLVASAPGWHTDPVVVRHRPTVPPVPVITGIRYAGHPEDGYDRIVFDIIEERRSAEKQGEGGRLTRIYEHAKTGEVFVIPDPGLRLDQLGDVQSEVAAMLA